MFSTILGALCIFGYQQGNEKKCKCLRVQMQCFSCESLSQLKMYLAPCQAFMIELFGENSYHLIAVNYICKNVPP